MRKVLLASLVICMLALLSTLSMSVHATPPRPASGIWTYIPADMTPIKLADDNTFFEVKSIDIVTGTFDGPGAGVDVLVLHSSGFWTGIGVATFEDCMVDGKSGTLVIRWAAHTTAETGLWSGQWVILSGTGDLANLRGQGTFWGPEEAGGFTYPYSGWIHFDPA